ncbi:hypothetical protein LWI29_020553 [Acer saccharum]|uniref:Xylanase inhibitor C-terminal domain-containing protein n=1 Tax=Acer saccharum TaxID=4024 RepID=A0AA39RDQ3_ACESA|nr:hypothetical protein LWI29_020553 [Acer saccharum]
MLDWWLGAISVSSTGYLELVHKHGPCSELKQGKADTPSWSEILIKDQARIHSINSGHRYTNSDENQFKQTESITFPFGYESSIGLGEYYAKVDIDTPGRFVYVILDTDSSSTGYLTFGKPDELNNKHIKFTPIPTTPQQSQFYDVVVTGISVARKKLPIKSSVFTRGGAVVDSGTVFTLLPPETFAVLRSAFRKGMAHYKLLAVATTSNGIIIDRTCYDFSSYKTVVIPKFRFPFEEGEVAILGNIMQQSVQVVYDLDGGRVGFGSGSCT